MLVVLVYWKMSYFCVTVEKLCLHGVLLCGLRKERKQRKVKCGRFFFGAWCRSQRGVLHRYASTHLLTGRQLRKSCIHKCLWKTSIPTAVNSAWVLPGLGHWKKKQHTNCRSEGFLKMQANRGD